MASYFLLFCNYFIWFSIKIFHIYGILWYAFSMKVLKNLCLILIVFGCAFVIFACGKSDTNHDAPIDNTPKTQEELEFEQFTNDYLALENLSKAYNSSNYQKRVVVYIRSSKYNSTQWNFLGGSVDDDFVAYVHENGSNLEYLRTNETLTYPNSDDEIDFVHMVATINLLMTGAIAPADLGGWGGDICQLVQEIKDTDKTGSELKELVQSKFNKTSSFGSEDVFADLDAVNIYNIYKSQSTKSFANAMSEYYKNVTTTTRKSEFSNYLFAGQSVDSVNQKVNYLFDRMSGNLYLGILNDSYGISFQDNESQFKMCLEVFVEFLI